MRILLVDHSDSYTHNLAHALAAHTGVWPTIVHTDQIDLAKLADFDAIVLSPGPGNVHEPRDVGRSLELLSHATQPILGICFGHQLIAHHLGAVVRRSVRPMHGHPVVVSTTNNDDPLWQGIPSRFLAMRYHSWCVDAHLDFAVLATSHESADERTEVMALRAGNRVGLQFHPESIATPEGSRIIGNFLSTLDASPAQPKPQPVRTEHTKETSCKELLAAPFQPLLAYAALQAKVPRSFFFDGEHAPERVTYVGELSDPVDPDTYSLPARSDERFAFTSGWVGAYGYNPNEREFYAVKGCLAYDHRTNQVFALDEVPAAVREAALTPARQLPTVSSSELTSLTTQSTYVENIKHVFELIRAGEVYQLCLTRALTCSPAPEPLAVYARLKVLSPARYGALLDFGHRVLVGNSPETLLNLEANGCATTKPIKGTRRRGKTPKENTKLTADLASAAKDRAENLMIVDVSRHDLGGVAELGSVQTPQLLEVETLPTVLQLVSTVAARVTVPAPQVVRALLPPASMTGAPKLRAVEHLARIEQRERGLYSGAYGWFSASGAASLAVTIRSAVISRDKNELTAGVGGAILLGSDPADEWNETELKAEALRRALR